MDNDFTIKMHWTMILFLKCIRQQFYYKNALDNDFTIKNALDNDFTIKNALDNDFTIKIHWTMFLL